MKVAAVGIVLAVLVAVIAVTVLFTRTDKAARPEIALALPAQIARPNPLRFEPGRTQEYEQAAAFGLSHVLFEKSPGGVLRAARRTARFREIVERAVSGSESRSTEPAPDPLYVLTSRGAEAIGLDPLRLMRKRRPGGLLDRATSFWGRTRRLWPMMVCPR